MRALKLCTVAATMVFAFGLANTSQAEMGTIYGPVYVAKHKHHHDGEKEAKFLFTAPVPGKGTIVVKNGGDSDKRHRVSSAKIELNDKKVGYEKDFNKKVKVVKYDVDLLAKNELEVEVKSCRDCEVEITVIGELLA